MYSIVIRQTVVVSLLVAHLCLAFLLGVLLMLGSTGAHSSQTGIMLIASPYHLA